MNWYIYIYIFMVVSSFPFKHQHALKSVISWHWLESVFMFPLIFGSPYHFSIQMQMSLSHTVPEHSVFLSSLIFPHRIVFASSIVLVTWTNQANFHLNSYMGSWDSITSASSSLVALLVLSTWFFISFWSLCSPSETSEFKDTNSLFCSSYVDRGLLRTQPFSEVLSGCAQMFSFLQVWETEIYHYRYDSSFLFLFSDYKSIVS